MNILVTTPTFHPCKGGAESFLEDLLKQFVHAGHRVTVVTSLLSNYVQNSENHNGLRIIRLRYPTSWLNQFTRSFAIFKHLWRTIRSEQIQIVCIGLVGKESIFVTVLQTLLRFKVVVFLHGSELRSYVKISKPVRWALKLALRNCKAAIAVSQALKEEAVSFEPRVQHKITVISCGVEFERIRAESTHVPKDRYVLFVGRLHKIKQIPTLIQAFKKVSLGIRDLKLFLAGIGPEEASLKKMVSDLHLQDRVQFLGDLERSDVFRLIQGCEAIVLPSASEGCPLTVLEALAAGKIVIATRAAGTIEIVKDGENGILFEIDDYEALSRKLFEFCTNATLRSAMENRVRASDLARYEIRNVARIHAEHYLLDSNCLRICLVSASYYQDENCGGIASYYFQLNKSLLEVGQTVHMITCTGNEGPKAGNEILLKPPWNELIASSDSNSRWKRLLLRFVFSYRVWRAAKQLEREQGLDIVVAPELFAQGFFLSLFMRKKLITRIHAPTVLVDEYNARHRFTGVSRILSIPEKFQARRSATLTVATSFLSKRIQALWNIPSEKIHIVRTGIDISWIRNLGMEKEEEFHGRYLLYFGRLEPLKGVEVLSKALKSVFDAVLDIRMIWIGRDWGSKTRIISDLTGYQDRMKFYDTMSKERLFPIVSHATLVILPSLFENFSNAGLEAMALGKPVLATLKTGFTEMIENEVNGFLTEPDDSDAMARRIIAYLVRNDLDEIGRKAYEAVMRFESKKVAQENVDFFKTVCRLQYR